MKKTHFTAESITDRFILNMADFQGGNPKPRRTYLVTYSQADLNKFPTRKSFGKCIKEAFNVGAVNVLYWACCLEEHENGGNHYHMSLKLSGPKRWKSLKQGLTEKHGITINFSDHHDNYYSAYKYVTKEDTHVQHSKKHPDLSNIGSPKTKLSTRAYRESRKRKQNEQNEQNKEAKNKKPRRLSNLEVSEFILNNNITRDTELFAAANTRKEAGEFELASYILSKSTKAVHDLLENTWKIKNATQDLERESTPRMDLIRQAAVAECVSNCNGEWLACAYELLQKNTIHPFVFAAALRDLLQSGRGKFRNIIITGPANCGKTFMLKPLENIYRAFANPANDKYAWIGADKAEIIVLQDFRWSSELITWKDLLLLLEGETVRLPAPKNQFADDVCIKTDVPIFATSKSKIEYIGKFNSRDERETEMMDVRWKPFSFHYQIAENEQKKVPSCSRCFAKLVLVGEMPPVS